MTGLTRNQFLQELYRQTDVRTSAIMQHVYASARFKSILSKLQHRGAKKQDVRVIPVLLDTTVVLALKHLDFLCRVCGTILSMIFFARHLLDNRKVDFRSS
jgi:hypothetical protein